MHTEPSQEAGLDIDKEPLTSVIFRIKDFELSGAEGGLSIIPVDRLVPVESGRDGSEVRKSLECGEEDYEQEEDTRLFLLHRLDNTTEPPFPIQDFMRHGSLRASMQERAEA